MDNGAYEKYKQENPDVYTPLSTYDYLDHFAQQLTFTDWVMVAVTVLLAVYAVYKLFFQRKDKHPDDHDN
jgi:hypothetical protein